MSLYTFVLPEVTASYSALTAFERCPRQYGETNFFKRIPFTSSPAMERGNQVHKAMEEYVKYGTPPPPGLAKFKNLVDKIVPGAAEVHAEIQVAINYDLKLTGYFAGDVCWRAKIDLAAIHPPGMVLVDFKTSSEPRETTDQLDFNVLAAFLKFPAIRKARSIFSYTEHKDRHHKVERTEITRIVEALYPRLERLRLAQANHDFPPNPGYQCKWCKVTQCEFNKNGR